MSRVSLSRRLRAAINVLRPPGSLADRIHRLSPDLRQRYETHLQDMAHWVAERPNGKAWADWLDGSPRPELPLRVALALGFSEPPVIPAGSDTEKAAEIYRKFLEIAK